MKTCSPVIVLAAACMLVVSAGALVLQPAKAGGQDGMPDVMFDLVFVSTPVNGVNHAVATSETMNTTFTSQGVVFTQRNVAGSTTATWLSTTGAQKGNTWSEVGNITFPSGDTIFFSSFGLSGHIKNGPTTGSSYGGISYDITGGTGKYEGASGVMVDTFIGPAGASSFPIHGVGFFWLPSSKQ